MRSIVLVVLVLAACTKPNPNVCCTDEADCNAKGIPIGSQCGEGLLCRGNQCIAQPCESSAACDLTAPYCVEMGCAESCTADEQCPGLFQGAEQQYCDEGACVECRTGMNECTAAAKPVCDTGVCRACTLHEECASGVCQSDGSCALASSIAYVEPSGAVSSDCDLTSPCATVARALAVTPPREFILISSGTYSSPTVITFVGKRSFIGRGATQPILTRSSPGPIVSLSIGAVASFDNLELSGATTNGADVGYAIQCNGEGGTTSVRLDHVTVAQNAGDGLSLPDCTFEVFESIFRDNAGFGLFTQDKPGTIDRSLVVGNGAGLGLDGGVYSVTNTFIVRNHGSGIDLYSTSPSNRIEFNTIVDNINLAPNQTTIGFACGIQNATGTFPNNIIARNTRQISSFSPNCSYANSIISDDPIISDLAFKSPDSPPYDYHITAGSRAIDAATASPVSYDFDGQARPTGNANDIGADELVP